MNFHQNITLTDYNARDFGSINFSITFICIPHMKKILPHFHHKNEFS